MGLVTQALYGMHFRLPRELEQGFRIKKYTALDTCYNSSHEVDLVQSIYPASRKLLFVYTVRTNSNKTILVFSQLILVMLEKIVGYLGLWLDSARKD